MRILICTNSLGARGGLEKITIVKANALAEIEGNEVAVCFTDKGTYPEDTIHPVSPGVRVYDLGVPFWDLYPLNLRNLMVTAPKKFMAMRRAIRKVIAEFSPDVVITTGSYEKFGVASLNPSKITGHRTVKIREFHFNSNYRRYIGNIRFPGIAELVDCHILPRFFDKCFLLTKEDLDANFPGNPKFDYVHNSLTFDIPENVPPVTARSRRVITAARLEAEKNIEAMLRVWKTAVSRTPGWSLEIVGDGSQRRMLENKAAELGISDSVTFAGYRKDVRDRLLDSRIFLFTSKCEGFGLAILEAMATGTVPLSFRTPYGPADIIDDGVSGVLVDYNDEGQMADRLVAMMDDGEMQARMSAEALKRVGDFSIGRIISRWTDKYSELLADCP